MLLRGGNPLAAVGQSGPGEAGEVGLPRLQNLIIIGNEVCGIDGTNRACHAITLGALEPKSSHLQTHVSISFMKSIISMDGSMRILYVFYIHSLHVHRITSIIIYLHLRFQPF